MKSNPIYELIKAYFKKYQDMALLHPKYTPEPLLGEEISIEPDTTLDGHDYYRLEFKREAVLLGDFQRGKHHISIHATLDNKHPCLSEYHYTAFFTQDAGAMFKLHVHFNQKDDYTIRPVFFKEDGTKVDLDDDFSNELLTLAIEMTSAPIAALRKKLKEEMCSLNADYKETRNHAERLSADIDKNYADYITHLTEMSLIQDKLAVLAPTEDYKARATLIRSMLKILAIKEKTTLHEEKEEELQSGDLACKPLAITPKFVAKARGIPLNDEISTLITHFDSIKVTDTKELLDVFTTINEYALLLEVGSYLVSRVSLEKLLQLQEKVHAACKALLPSLLINKDMASAKKLCSFHDVLTSNDICIALATRNHEALDFILEHGDFIINDKPLSVKVKGVVKDYPSALHYCIAKHSPKKSMVDCLAVLIHHGGSLLAKDGRGLPLAHSILLSTMRHPLMDALEATKSCIDKTLGSRRFFKQLETTLSDYLAAKADLDEAEKKTIRSHIAFYKARQKMVGLVRSKATLAKPEADAEYCKNIMTDYSGAQLFSFLEQLRNDLDIMRMLPSLEISSKEARKHGILVKIHKDLHNESESMKDITISIDKKLKSYDYDELKKAIIHFFENFIKANQILNEKQELCAERHKSSTGPKKYKAIEKRLSTLKDEENDILLSMVDYINIDLLSPAEKNELDRLMMLQEVKSFEKQVVDVRNYFLECTKSTDKIFRLFDKSGPEKVKPSPETEEEIAALNEYVRSHRNLQVHMASQFEMGPP